MSASYERGEKIESTWRGRMSRGQMRVLQIAVSLGLLALLYFTLDGAEAARILSRADPRWLVLGWAVMVVQTLLSALRWKLIAADLGQSFTFWKAQSEYFMSQVLNQSLPGGMMGDAGRAYRARKQAGLLKASQAVVFERIAQQAGMFAIFAGTFVVTTILPGGLRWPVWLTSITTPALLIGLALPAVFWLTSYLPGPQRRYLESLKSALWVSLLKPRRLPVHVLLSLITSGCNILAFYACARAIGTELPLAATLGLVPLILFMMLVPFTIAGWGLREGAAATIFPVAGASGSAGLAASVAFGLIFLAAVLPGLWPILKRRK
ncbi:lysylphosphatidylglycerol synthase transmembrane domain-containing protein [Litorisediminicola beolgyonensis]|uniref:YbhN family protein n=1 Tax=Litorisediminicola beolgyonensis TaxID=1173614 RepID=A0ABW3ZIJ7_9RHOB